MSKPTHEPEVFAKLLENNFEKAFQSCTPGVQWEARIVLLIRTLDKSTLSAEEKNKLLIACLNALRLQHKVDAAHEILTMMQDLHMEALPTPIVVAGYGAGVAAHLTRACNHYFDAILPHKKELGL